MEQQVAFLRRWAREQGILVEAALFEPRIKGGREHYLVKTPEFLQRLIKVTIGPEFGYYPCCFPRQQFRDVCNWFSTRTATPLEYCERLLLLNELFPRCETQLIGLVDRGDSLHAVTAQLIARGHPAAHHRMIAWLNASGFVMIAAWTWFRPADGVALFDVMAKNVMHCDDGEMVPFDVIPLRCEGVFLEMMHAAEARLSSHGQGARY